MKKAACYLILSLFANFSPSQCFSDQKQGNHFKLYPHKAPLLFPRSAYWEDFQIETPLLKALRFSYKKAVFRDIGICIMRQSPYVMWGPAIDESATVWSSDLNIHEFFIQDRKALQTLDFNF